MGKFRVTATVGWFDKGHKTQENVPIEYFSVGKGKTEVKSDSAKTENDLNNLFNQAVGARYLKLAVVHVYATQYFKDSIESITLFIADSANRIVMTSSCKESLKIFREKANNLALITLSFQDADECFSPVKT